MQFIGLVGSVDTVHRENDANGRMKPNFWFLSDFRNVRPDDFALLDYFQNAYWPGNSNLYGDAAGVYGEVIAGLWWESPEKISGSTSRFGVTGISRDAFNSPLAGVTLRLFKTDDNTLQDQQVSDTNGVYLLTTPYYQAHYIVAYKASSPDVTGATANTLVPGT